MLSLRLTLPILQETMLIFHPTPLFVHSRSPSCLNSVRLLIQAGDAYIDIIPDSPISTKQEVLNLDYLVSGVISLLKFYAEVCT